MNKRLKQVAEIFEGSTNFILHYAGGMLSEEKQLIAEQRLEMCRDCPIRTGNLCDPSKTTQHLQTGEEITGCGCIIPVKVLAMSSDCPKGAW